MNKRSIIFILALFVTLFVFQKWFSKDEKPQTKTQIVEKEILSPSSTPMNQEEFYVIENEYQQLVFSNIGGALAEINLPFKSTEHPESVVLPIEFDRLLAKNSPNNDLFPSSPYKKWSPTGTESLSKRQLGGYYPLLRRSIEGTSSHVSKKLSPSFYGLNVYSTQGEESGIYHVTRLEKSLIEFQSTSNNRKITKTFSFPQNSKDAPYFFDLKIKVEGDARNLALSSGIPEVELISGSWTPTLKYRMSHNDKVKIEQLDLPKTAKAISSVYPDWVSNSNGFLGLIIDPLDEIGPGFTARQVSGDEAPSRITLIDKAYDLYPAKDYPGYMVSLPLRAGNDTVSFRVFAGPLETDVLKIADITFADPANGYNPDYVDTQSFHGWFAFISEPFAKFLFFLMNIFHKVTHSWGFSIILLTIALRLMLYPLNGWSIKSMSRMQQIAPQVTAIQEKYKKDPKRAQLEVITLYREQGVNPLTGCFPILIQIPFLIGMFDLLKSTFELRGASFIPGWIDNLTAPDVLFSWSYPIYFFGNSFHLLPILLGVVMFFQQRLSGTGPKDPNLMTDQQRQQRFMGNIMVVVFAVMFYKFPSGLNIYWLSSMLLGILQQWFMTRKLPKPSKVVVLHKK